LVQDAVAADRLAGADQLRPIVPLLRGLAVFLSGLSGLEVHRPDMGTIGTEKSDGELVNASRRGEHQAFGQLVARYQDLVCAVSYSSTGDHVLSEDVAQETFIAAWRQLSALRDIGRLRPWLCGIARNLARKARKARRRDELVEAKEPVAEGNPFDEAARGQVERLVRDALGRVPETYREVLVLYYRENQSIREVAEALDTSET